jgi:hypothetical protein
MPKNFVRRTFDQWLGQNLRRFRHAPSIVEQRKHYFILRFDGITNRLQCFIGWNSRVEIHVLHDGGIWDILTDFDLVERRTPDGAYRCALCAEPIDYSSRETLWINEAFEPLLSWVEETLATAQTLSCYEQPGGGARYAQLSKAGEVGAMDDEWLVATFPISAPLSGSHNHRRDRQLPANCRRRGGSE